MGRAVRRIISPSGTEARPSVAIGQAPSKDDLAPAGRV